MITENAREWHPPFKQSVLPKMRNLPFQRGPFQWTTAALRKAKLFLIPLHYEWINDDLYKRGWQRLRQGVLRLPFDDVIFEYFEPDRKFGICSFCQQNIDRDMIFFQFQTMVIDNYRLNAPAQIEILAGGGAWDLDVWYDKSASCFALEDKRVNYIVSMVQGIMGQLIAMNLHGVAINDVYQSTFSARNACLGRRGITVHTITIKPDGRPRFRACLNGTHSPPREHDRRGHIRRLRSGREVWVRNTIVGQNREGLVLSNYRINALRQDAATPGSDR